MEDYTTKKMEIILKKIRETRKLKGFSHENMAIELDISPSAYNKLERRETALSLERFLKISEILNLSLVEILDLKTGDTLHQDLKDNSIGKVETLYQENKEVNEKLIIAKDEQIALLKTMLEREK